MPLAFSLALVATGILITYSNFARGLCKMLNNRSVHKSKARLITMLIWLRSSKEHCLVGYKGNPQLNRNVDCDVVVAEVRTISHHIGMMFSVSLSSDQLQAALAS